MRLRFPRINTSLLLVLLFVTSTTAAFPSDALHKIHAHRSAATRDLVVGLRPMSGAVERNLITFLGRIGTVKRLSPALHAAVVHIPAGGSLRTAVCKIQRLNGVAFVESARIMHTCATPNDPSYSTLQYAPQKIKADYSWDIWKPQSQVVVAVIDTGIETTHPDLKNVIYRNSDGFPIAYNCLTGSFRAEDDSGHGTHCAGVIGAQINNATGVAGIVGWNPNIADSGTYVKLMAIKALDAAGNGTDANVADGIVWAADHGARVLCISSATSSTSNLLANAVQYAWTKGCVIVAGAGNDAATDTRYPAAYDHVISVAATDETDTLVDFSEYGTWVKVAAPGSNIFSTYLNGSYSPLTGTSTAAPHVAAEAAAIMSQNPTFTNADIEHVIVSNMDPVLPNHGHALGRGIGRIDVQRGLTAAGVGDSVITCLTLRPAHIGNQTTSLGAVQLGGPAPAGGKQVALSSSDPTVATVPDSVLVPEGATFAEFTVTAGYVASLSRTVIAASTAVDGAQAVLVVDGPQVQSLTLNPASVSCGVNAVATVTLDSPAPATGAAISLSSDSPSIASVPISVTVPGGQWSATFNVTTYPVSRRYSLQITASFGGADVSSTMVVNPVTISKVTLSPSTVVGGGASVGTVTLSGPAPTGGGKVALSSGLPSQASVPSNVSVPEGKTTATFAITTTKTNSKKPVAITAAYSTVATATLTVLPMLKSVTVSPASLTGGAPARGTASLNAPAPAGGALVVISTNASSVTAPATALVLEGATSATFDMTTVPVAASVSATVTASYAGASVAAKLTVKPPAVSRLVLSPASVKGGAPSSAIVSLTGPAPAAGVTVSLSSSNPKAVVPSPLTIPAGASSATFSVSTYSVAVKLTATISAAAGGVAKTAVLTINP